MTLTVAAMVLDIVVEFTDMTVPIGDSQRNENSQRSENFQRREENNEKSEGATAHYVLPVAMFTFGGEIRYYEPQFHCSKK